MNYTVTTIHESGDRADRPFGPDFVSASLFYKRRTDDYIKQLETVDDPIVTVRFSTIIAEVNESNTLANRYGL